jgi:hypothetical protein
MMEISIWLGLALATSVSINVVFFWLAQEQSSRLSVIADNTEDLIEMIVGFKDHLKAVYSLDTFYGDETLKALMDHAGSLSTILEDQYGDIASLSEQIEYEETEVDNDGSEENQKEKHVLYAGTRRRDS